MRSKDPPPPPLKAPIPGRPVPVESGERPLAELPSGGFNNQQIISMRDPENNYRVDLVTSWQDQRSQLFPLILKTIIRTSFTCPSHRIASKQTSSPSTGTTAELYHIVPLDTSCSLLC